MTKSELGAVQDPPEVVQEPAVVSPAADEDRLISLGEVGRQLRVYIHVIVYWETSGLIRSIRKDGLKLVRVSDINKLLDGSFGPLHGKRVH